MVRNGLPRHRSRPQACAGTDRAFDETSPRTGAVLPSRRRVCDHGTSAASGRRRRESSEKSLHEVLSRRLARRRDRRNHRRRRLDGGVEPEGLSHGADRSERNPAHGADRSERNPARGADRSERNPARGERCASGRTDRRAPPVLRRPSRRSRRTRIDAVACAGRHAPDRGTGRDGRDSPTSGRAGAPGRKPDRGAGRDGRNGRRRAAMPAWTGRRCRRSAPPPALPGQSAGRAARRIDALKPHVDARIDDLRAGFRAIVPRAAAEPATRTQRLRAPAAHHAVSWSKATTLRDALLNSTPTRWTGAPAPRYLSA